MQLEGVDHFKILEERIESLIQFITSLKEENKILRDKNRSLEEKLDKISGEMEDLKRSKGQARDRVLSLLQKIEGLDI